jgi:RHS repeat-associated protein
VTTDHLGSTRLLTKADGTVAVTYDYLPFGMEFAQSADTNRIRFTGKERDAETGLDYFLAGYDSSAQGRFTSPDPVGGSLADPQTLNKYAYVRNNPLNLTDPTGLYACADDAKDATEHCTSDSDQLFEAARQRDLQSKNGDVRRAAAAYGKPGEEVVDERGDKVTVGFADLGKRSEGGETVSQLSANGAVPISVSSVTINSRSQGTALEATVGHEGSHVADAQDMAASILSTTTTFTVGQDISQYASEQRAYRVTDAIYRSANEPYNGCGNANCALGAGSSPIGIGNRIDQILVANPRLYHSADGKPLTQRNQGGNVLNIVVPH